LLLFLIVILLISVAVWLTSGCKEATSSEGFEGLTLALAEPNGPIAREHIFNLAPQDTFHKEFLFGNMQKKEHNYAVSLFVDFKQRPFILDGQNQLLHRITLGAFEERKYDLKIMGLSPGIHDAFLLVVVEPDNHSTDPKFREATLLSQTVSFRFTLIVGESKETHVPKGAKIAASNFKYPSPPLGSLKKGWLTVNNEPDMAGKLWLDGTSVQVGSEVPYYIHVCNDDASPQSEQDYVLIALLDWYQIPINDKIPILQFSLDKKQRLRVPAVVKLSDPGKHELTVLLVEDPYELIPGGSEFGGAVIPSNRILLIAQ
jgi:hypothetical protein